MQLRQLRSGLIATVILATAFTAPTWALNIQSFSQTGTDIGLYEPLFLDFGLDTTYQNPYDPRQIDVTCEFTGPSGVTHTIPAFFADDTPGWEARIAPMELGTHQGTIVAEDGNGNTDTHSFTFNAVASNSPGFVRIDTRDGRYMAFDDGTPYFPVGMNVDWGAPGPFYPAMGTVGVNWTRLWLSTTDVEWNGAGGTLGVYDQATQIQQVDTIVNSAATNGLYLQLCFDSFTEWNTHSFDEWHENPYNNDNGGPLENPIDHFYNAESLRLAKQRARYIVARWAYSPHILCWELWNEVDAVGWGQDWSLGFWANIDAVRSWHATMGQYIRSIDPFEHLRTTSFANTGADVDGYNTFWALPEMDIVQAHRYSVIYPSDHINTIRDYEVSGKPVILGEAGKEDTPPDNDPSGTILHDLIWPGAVCQSGAMSWWWDWIEQYDLYYRFEPLLAYLAGEDFAAENLGHADYTVLNAPSGLQVYGSSGNQSAYLWLLYWSGGVYNASIQINNLTPGTYDVEYWDTNAGSVAATETVTANGSGEAILSFPDFTRDIAVKVKTAADTPMIALSPTTLEPSADEGSSPADQTFTVTNSGTSTLSYSISDNVSWLSVSPTSGTSTGESDTITVSYSTASLAVGTYSATISVTDPNAGNTPQSVSVSLTINPDSLISNGNFANGLTGWTQWTQRGSFAPSVTNGQLHIQSSEMNGGMWQQFNTGGAGTVIDITGWWASNPTVADNMWAEVLVINGSRTPADGSDVNDSQSDVVMIYKNDSWTTPSGWSGDMDQTAPVTNVGSFTADGSVATIVLKHGNIGGSTTGIKVDDVIVTSAGSSPTPTINLSTSTMSATTLQGSDAASDSFTVANSGSGTLNYSISTSETWLSVWPTTGDSTGEADTIDVTYSTSSLAAGNYTATITVSDPNATNDSQTINVDLTVNALPTISLSTGTLSPTVDEGDDASDDSFTVTDTGGTGSELNYSVSDNVNWLSVSPTSGTSTGEADTITVDYATSSLAAGTYNATITVSDPNATNNPQTISVSLTVNEIQVTTVAEDFDSMPSWSSSFDASWGSAASWSIISGGQSGNALQASRSSGGSSAKAQVYTIDANTDYTLTLYIKCPSDGDTYWTECAYKFGSQTAENFDQDASSWTLIKKFSNTGTNGNGNSWTQYTKTFNSGSNTQITIGYKLGSSGGDGPDVAWDTLRIE